MKIGNSRLYKRFINSLMAVILTTPVMLIDLQSQHIFVSPNGNDDNNGRSMANPVQSFQKAADIAKSLGSDGIIVEFAGGTYVFNNTVVLDASYSGITFESAEGVTPIFTSLVQVTDWEIYNGNIMSANSPLSKGRHIRYLQDQSEDWMKRSETVKFRANEATINPEDSYHDPARQQNKLNIQHPSSFNVNIDWTKAGQYDLRASQSAWNQELLPIASYNAAQDRIFTKVPSNYEMRVHATEAIWPSENWVINTIAGIDEAGEWAVIDDVIYLWPSSGTDDIYIPQLTELIRIDAGGYGNTWTGSPVQNITFNGLTFTGGDFYALEPEEVATTHDWAVVDKPTALLRLRNASQCTITNCNFTKSGGTGIRLDRFAQNHAISNNVIDFMGRSGISLIGRGPGYGDVNNNNLITNNVIKSIGREKWTSIGILLDQSANNTITKNYIEDTYFSAIAITGPKQFVFMNHVWGTFIGNTWQGRDFHTHEFKPSTYNTISETSETAFDNGTWDAMSHLYSGNNTIENNGFINTNSGQGYLVQSVIYISGITRHQSNFIRYNYINETVESSTNSSVIWADSDQDNTDWIGNMVFNIDIGDTEPEPAIVFRANAHCLGAEDAILHDSGDRALIRANVGLNSNYAAFTGFDIGDFRVEDDNATSTSVGNVSNVAIYEAMWSAICPEVVAGQTLSGAIDFQSSLASIISKHGGLVPSCDITTRSVDLAIDNSCIKLYPNPTFGHFIIDGDLQDYTVQILSSDGSVFQNLTGQSMPIDIHLDTLPAGLYFIKVFNTINANLCLQQIIKM